MGESLDRNRCFASGVILFILVSSLFSLPTVAKTAEVYPNRGTEFIVDSKAGGGNDMLARGGSPFHYEVLEGGFSRRQRRGDQNQELSRRPGAAGTHSDL